MEIVYFIIGVLSSILGYGIVLLHKTKSSHTSLLEELNTYRDITFENQDYLTKRDDIRGEEMENMVIHYKSIQEKMEDDAYEGNTELNRRISELSRVFNDEGNKTQKLFDIADKQLRGFTNDISILKNQLKAFKDDPNLKARY